jgi:hypothetical protein
MRQRAGNVGFFPLSEPLAVHDWHVRFGVAADAVEAQERVCTGRLPFAQFPLLQRWQASRLHPSEGIAWPCFFMGCQKLPGACARLFLFRGQVVFRAKLFGPPTRGAVDQ